MKIHKYPDGSSYVELTKEDTRNKLYTFRVNSYNDLWVIAQFVDAFNNVYRKAPTILIPNLIDAQADRRFKHDHSSGLKIVCEFLDKLWAEFKIFHPHNPEVVEALIDGVEIIDNSQFLVKTLATISSYEYQNNVLDSLILMSSDAGGFKPLMRTCDKIGWQGETYSASKSRMYKDEKSTLTQIVDRQDFQGKDILIVDDLCVYGGTFKGLSKLLKERNCGKLYLAVSHITMHKLGMNPVTNYYDWVFTTNSKFSEYFGMYDCEGGPPVERKPNNLKIFPV